MNIANSVNISLNLIYQGKEVTIPTLKLPTLSQETLELISLETGEDPILLNSFTDRIKTLKDVLTKRNQAGTGILVLMSLTIGVIAALAVSILSPIVGVIIGCAITGLSVLVMYLPGKKEELEASLDLGKIADFLIKNDRTEKLLEKKCLAQPTNLGLQSAYKEFQKAKAFYSKYTKMRVPCISPASTEVLKMECDYLGLQFDQTGFDLSGTENSALEELSESILDLKTVINHSKYYKIVYLLPLTLLIGSIAFGIFSFNPITCILGLATLCIAFKGFMLKDICEEEVNNQRLIVEKTTGKLKAFFTQDFDVLIDSLQRAMAGQFHEKDFTPMIFNK